MLRLIILFCLLTSVLHAEGMADTYSDRRKDLQGQFSRAQKTIYPDPAKATKSDNDEMEKVNSAISELKSEILEFEQGRYRNWYRKSYWYYGRTDYWESGPGARRILDKLSVLLAKIKAMPLKQSGPFVRSDLNDSQKLLDALREALALDAELEQIVKVYLRK